MSKKNLLEFLAIEKKRAVFASEKRYSELKKTYSPKFPEIKNPNTSSFWDKKLSVLEPLSQKDGLTNTRVKCAVNFLPENAKKILDIGAGQGYLEELLIKKNELEIYSNDISKKGIDLLKTRFYGDFRVMSVYNLKYPNGFFDAVFALEVLEHIPPSRIFSVLKSIHRLISTNGYLIVSVPINEHLENMNNNPSGHLRDYKKELLIAELEICGYKILETQCFSAFNSNFRLKSVLQKTIFRNRWEYNDIVVKAQKA